MKFLQKNPSLPEIKVYYLLSPQFQKSETLITQHWSTGGKIASLDFNNILMVKVV